jgi:hypothetical protein
VRRLNSPVFLYPLLTLLVLGSGAAVYLFPWLSSREASLNNTALLSLAATGDQLTKRLGSMASVLDALKRRKQPGQEEEYLRAQAPWLEYEDAKTCTRAGDPESVLLEIGERRDERSFQVSDADHCVSASVEKILSELLPRSGIFEEVILAEQDGKTIFQTGLTALRITDVTALLQQPENSSKQAQPTGPPPSAAPSVRQVRVGDADYQLYLMPAPFSGLVKSGGKQNAFVLAGLIRQSRLRSMALAQSGTLFVTVALFALLVLFAGWPLLKFSCMGATERVRRWSGLALLSSILASTGLACLLVFHFSYLLSPDPPVRTTGENGKQVIERRPETDARLKDLAGDMSAKARSELRGILETLDAAERSSAFLTAAITPGTKPQQMPVKESVLTRTPALFSSPYPFFDDIYWADAAGNEQIKWTAHATVTPQTLLTSYPFFTEAMNGNLWSLCRPGDDPVCPARRFRVDPFYARNSGEYIAVITTPSRRPGLAIVAMTTRLASLEEPVLPADYGFAVVDEDGEILFHSDPGANTGRNVYPDFENANAMRAAAASRAPQRLDAEYQGEPARFYVTPFSSLAGCPWTLMVFRRDAALEAKHVERMLLFFALLVLFGAVAGLVGIAVFIRLPHYPPRWLWPEPSRNAEYLQLAAALFLIYGAGVAMAFSRNWGAALAGSFLCGTGGFLVAFLHLRRSTRPLGVLAVGLACASVWFHSLPLAALSVACAGLIFPRITGALKRVTGREPEPNGLMQQMRRTGLYYSFAATALVFVAGVLPAIGFFKVANDFTHIKFLMRDQLLTFRQLEERFHRLRLRYSSLLAAKGQAQDSWDAQRELILRARLNSSWDRLDDMSDSGWSPNQVKVWQEWALPAVQKIADMTSFVPNPGADLARKAAPDANGAGCRPDSVCWSFESQGWLRIHRPSSGPDPVSSELNPMAGANLPESLIYPYSELSSLDNSWAIVFLAILGILLFVWLWKSLTKLFLLDVPIPAPWPAAQIDKLRELRGNIIAVGWQGSGKTAELSRQNGLNVLDMGLYLRENNACWNPERPGIAVLDHFDAALNTLEDDRAVSLLENLLRSGQRIVIVSNSDPRFCIEQWLAGTPDEKKLAIASRWEAALARFQTVLLSPASGNGDPPFETLWAGASAAERVSLFQLAHDGWANHKNREALLHLWRRGIVVRDPVFRIRNEQFEQWIQNRVPARQSRDWSRAEGPSAWDGMRIVFVIVGLAIVAAALFWAQHEGWALGTLASAAGSAAKMVADFRGRKTAAIKEAQA